MKEREYISLKEAAKLSGYSADYVGQLIRSGKIQGKQVFSNVSWVTTEKAIQAYIEKERTGQKVVVAPSSLLERLASIEGLGVLYTVCAWTVVCLLTLFVLFLVYVFSVSIDHAIEQRYLQTIHHA